ncbi:MAG TPA: VWA domain-containing protein, partial [Terriglobales bacterium]|nr:VWA domain-containing protein [Terriglobales bacterium]
MRRWMWLVIALPVFIPSTPAQEPETPSLRTTVNEVLLDMVVRDKKAHLIRDLKPEEVQIFEDGVPQKLRHFDFFQQCGPAVAAAQPVTPAVQNAPAREANTPHSVQELRDISVVSVVVSQLDPQGRKLTLDTMRDFVKSELQPNTYVGVFWLARNELRPVQTYTNDAAKITDAVTKAVTGVGMQDRTVRVGLRPTFSSGWDGDSTENDAPDNLGLGDTGSSDPVSQAIANVMATEWVVEMHDVYQDSIDYLTQLHKLVQSQSSIPGRKVVLLFSGGLPMHPDTIEVFKNLISSANRANVSIYAIDTVPYGRSDLTNSRRMLAAAANASRQQQMGMVSGGDQSVTPMEVMSGAVAEGSIRADTRGNLSTLAEDTGGALLSTSMDLPKALGRVLEEVQTHYELSYSPTNSSADGKFRNVQVKVSRPGAVVFTRNGYFALPMLNQRQIYPFEIATLKALNAKPLPQDFKFHAAALQFRQGQRRTQYSFVFEVPAAGLTITEEKPWAKVH